MNLKPPPEHATAHHESIVAQLHAPGRCWRCDAETTCRVLGAFHLPRMGAFVGAAPHECQRCSLLRALAQVTVGARRGPPKLERLRVADEQGRAALAARLGPLAAAEQDYVAALCLWYEAPSDAEGGRPTQWHGSGQATPPADGLITQPTVVALQGAPTGFHPQPLNGGTT